MLFRYFTDLVDIDDYMEKDCFADVLLLCILFVYINWGVIYVLANFFSCFASILYKVILYIFSFLLAIYVELGGHIDIDSEKLECGVCLWLLI